MLDLRAAPMCVSNTRAYTAFPFRTRAFPFPAHFPLLDRYHSAQAHIECRAELGSVCIAHTIYDAFLALTRALQRSACRDGRRDAQKMSSTRSPAALRSCSLAALSSSLFCKLRRPRVDAPTRRTLAHGRKPCGARWWGAWQGGCARLWQRVDRKASVEASRRQKSVYGGIQKVVARKSRWHARRAERASKRAK